MAGQDRDDQTAKERSLPYGIIWALFLISMFVGAGLVWNPDPVRRAWGLTLMVAPLVLFGLLMAAFYWRSRRIHGPAR